jgi:hypothetical protein
MAYVKLMALRSLKSEAVLGCDVRQGTRRFTICMFLVNYGTIHWMDNAFRVVR